MTKDFVLKKIAEILDPDLGISIVELGLIYNVSVKGKTVEVLMTLTTPMCPLASTIEGQIKKNLKGHASQVYVSFTFNPPWNLERISEDTKLKLGILS